VFGDRTNCRPPDRTAETIDVKKVFLRFFILVTFLNIFLIFQTFFYLKEVGKEMCRIELQALAGI